MPLQTVTYEQTLEPTAATSALKKATAAAIAFGIFGIIGITFSPINNTSLLSFIFYEILVLNTFFSVKTFSRIIPSFLSQNIIDCALVIFYGILATQFENQKNFVIASTAYFCITTIKYSILIKDIPKYKSILKRKIFVNVLGVVMFAVSLQIIYMGYETAAALFYTIAFALANIYLLAVKPLYVLPR